MFSKTSPDEVPREMLALLVELLASAQLPELAIGGAWHAMYLCLTGRPELAKWAIEELGLFDLGMEHFRAIGSPADVVSISRPSTALASRCVQLPLSPAASVGSTSRLRSSREMKGEPSNAHEKKDSRSTVAS